MRLLSTGAGEQFPEGPGEVLAAGWQLQHRVPGDSTLSFDDLRTLHSLHASVQLGGVSKPLAELITRIRSAGISVSDRRAVRLQKIIAGSALLCGRLDARVSDLWVLKHIWDTEEQQEPLRGIVQSFVDSSPETAGDHPRARSSDEPDPEALAKDLEGVEQQCSAADANPTVVAQIRDRLALIEARLPWVRDQAKRDLLQSSAASLWTKLPASTVPASQSSG